MCRAHTAAMDTIKDKSLYSRKYLVGETTKNGETEVPTAIPIASYGILKVHQFEVMGISTTYISRHVIRYCRHIKLRIAGERLVRHGTVTRSHRLLLLVLSRLLMLVRNATR